MTGATPDFDGRAFARGLGNDPGVYRMLDAEGQVLYVGKAQNLSKRVGSYFSRSLVDPRLKSMRAQIAAIEVVVTRTEAEALLLENQLIKALKPRYNILLRDDKSYPYIYLSSDESWPRMGFHRGARSAPGRYFGPYPSAWAVRESLSLMQKLFRVRQCEDSVFRNRSRPCLQYQIKRCSAPCVGLISVEAYAADVRRASLFLDGQSQAVVDELGREMELAAQRLDFERAAMLRDQISALRRVQARQFVSAGKGDFDVLACAMRGSTACVEVMFFRGGNPLGNRAYFPRLPSDAEPADVLHAFIGQYYLEREVPPELLLSHAPAEAELLEAMLSDKAGRKLRLASRLRGDRARLVELAMRNAEHALGLRLASQAGQAARLEALRELLELDETPERIECFDVSHTQGEATVAACVVFSAEGPVKSDYRRFNISGVTGGDDYAALRQALERRYRRLREEEARVPDLLLIDGGHGQLRQAREVLAELGIGDVCLVAIAKGPERRSGEETLILAHSGRELKPPATSPAAHLLQQIRDEAHRFAIAGHRARRAKTRQSSPLEDIPGIGSRRRALLLRHFGGLRGLRRAGVEELCQVPGIHRELAQRIHDALREGG